MKALRTANLGSNFTGSFKKGIQYTVVSNNIVNRVQWY